MDLRWLNVSTPLWLVGRKGIPIRLFQAFNRVSTEGHWWGVGVLQCGNRHLLLVAGSHGAEGARGIYPFFLRRTQ